MPRLPLYTVDAFTRNLFCGNGAAVMLLEKPLPDALCQKIAAEIKLAETAFMRPLSDKSFSEESNFELRWFTPTFEVPLCGHATLSTVHVLFNELSNVNETISFETRLSGILHCSKTEQNAILMNFPQYSDVRKISVDQEKNAPACLNQLISHIVGDLPLDSIHFSPNAKILILMLDKTCTRTQLESLNPSAETLKQIYPEADYLTAVSVTLAGSAQNGCVDDDGRVYDFVSRYFSPWTGYMHCALAPLWQKYLNKIDFCSFQCYPGRGGEFKLALKPNDRIDIVGSCVTVMNGVMNF